MSSCPAAQEWLETERACYLMRQHVYASLSHRLGTRPFLSHVEKVCFYWMFGWGSITEHTVAPSARCAISVAAEAASCSTVARLDPERAF